MATTNAKHDLPCLQQDYPATSLANFCTAVLTQDFDRLVAETQIRIAVLSGYTALGIELYPSSTLQRVPDIFAIDLVRGGDGQGNRPRSNTL